MKMAAAEALYHTQTGASFSLLTIGNLSGLPDLPDPGTAPAEPDRRPVLERQGARAFTTSSMRRRCATGPGSYIPVIWVTYWSFRIMVGLGLLMLVGIGVGLVAVQAPRSRMACVHTRWTLWVLVACIAAPFLANTFGWLFTEMGRQPWIVYGLMKTAQASSPSVSATDVA